MRRLAALAGSLVGSLASAGSLALLGACSTPLPPLEDPPFLGGAANNSCDEVLITPLGEFRALNRWLSWRSPTDNSPGVGLDFDILLEPFQPDDKLDTFTGLGDNAQLWVFFDSRFEQWERNGQERQPRFLEARIGDAVLRTDLGGSVAAHSPPGAISGLLTHAGDLELKLLDGNGAVLQSMVVPRTVLVVVEETLREMQVRVMANLADKAHRCRLVPEIVMI